jgi:FtsP/CotA-like multicopper oxidase with cupredoxin domain
MRVGTGGRCDGPNANAANIKSIFRYAGAGSGDPNSTAAAPLPVGCDDETNIVPWQKTTVPQSMPEELEVGFNTNFTTSVTQSVGLVQWLINGIPMAIDLDHPTLQSVADGDDTSFNASRHVFEVTEKHNWQYWVIQQAATAPPLPHPIHLHGHDFYVLDSQANAQWSGDLSRLKTDNPIRRDTHSLPAGGYLVLAFESDNPGAWLMHCHIPFHIAAGLGVQFLERKSEIVGSIGSLGPMNEGCKNWQSYHEEYHPNGILIPGDSGL